MMFPLAAPRPGELPSWALVMAARRPAAAQAAVRFARAIGALCVTIALLVTGWLARLYGPDDAVVWVASRSAALLTYWAGGVAALGLAARSSRDEKVIEAVENLALARGFSHRAVRLAEIAACGVVVIEVVLLPALVLAVGTCALVALQYVAGAWRALVSVLIYAATGSVILGTCAGCCRVWGGRAGRAWFIGVIVVPWVLSLFSTGGVVHDWASIPGLLGHAW